MESVSLKRKLTSNAALIRQTEDENHREITIDHDHTTKEEAQKKKLLQETIAEDKADTSVLSCKLKEITEK